MIGGRRRDDDPPRSGGVACLIVLSFASIHLAPEHGFRADHTAVFAVEIGERHRVNFISGTESSVKVRPRKREAGISDKIRLEPQIARHSNRRFDRVIRGTHAGNDECADTRGTELFLKRCADKGAIRSLREDDFTRYRCDLVFEIVALLTRSIGRFGGSRVVTNMNDSASISAKPRGAARFSFRHRHFSRAVQGVIAGVDSSLHVDDDQGCSSESTRRFGLGHPGSPLLVRNLVACLHDHRGRDNGKRLAKGRREGPERIYRKERMSMASNGSMASTAPVTAHHPSNQFKLPPRCQEYPLIRARRVGGCPDEGLKYTAKSAKPKCRRKEDHDQEHNYNDSGEPEANGPVLKVKS